MSKMMSAAVIDHYRQAELRFTTMPQPTMGPTDVLVKIRAASLNPIDFKTMHGDLRLLLHYQFPLIIGSDFAGQVAAVGEQVTTFKVGDAVYGRPRKNRIGTFATYLAIDATEIALMPAELSYTEAAALPLVGLTSYQALHDLMHLQPGQRVLIQAGAGGIGTTAIQLAKSMGAYVATTTSAKHAELVTALGADQVIDYHQTDFTTVLKDYDAVFDTLGGKSLLQAFQIVKPGGHVVSISGLPNAKFATEYGLPFWKRSLIKVASWRLSRLARKSGSQYHFLFMQPSGAELTQLTTLVTQAKLRPIIDRTYPFEQVNEALAYSKQGHATGKIIIEIGV